VWYLCVFIMSSIKCCACFVCVFVERRSGGIRESEVIMAQMSDVAALCLHCDTSEKAPARNYCSSWDRRTAKLREISLCESKCDV
jgi:hypothetical protein